MYYDLLHPGLEEDKNSSLDVLWLVSWHLKQPRQGWSGSMQPVMVVDHSGKANISFFLWLISFQMTKFYPFYTYTHYSSGEKVRIYSGLNLWPAVLVEVHENYCCRRSWKERCKCYRPQPFQRYCKCTIWNRWFHIATFYLVNYPCQHSVKVPI